MGANFSRLKTWIAEKVLVADLNAEFNNILDNMTPSGMDDASANVAAMQVQTDPGEVGSEVLATSLSGEIEALRHQIAELKGTTYWYTSPVTTLASLNTIFGNGGIPPSRLVGGETTGNSSQSYLLTPEGSAGDNIVINGATVDLVYSVDATEFTLSSDITISATTTPPITNNTATINDASLADQDWTKWTGMFGGGMPIDAIGSEITSRNGKLTAFKLTTGAGSEYFLGTPDTTNNQIKDIKRGYYFDESGDPIPSIIFADNDTLTLMSIAYIFLVNDNTAAVTYNEPVVSSTEPSSPTNGDYWYDLINQTWKTFGGVSFAASNAAYIGTSITDENDDCVGARSDDFTKTYLSGNTLELEYLSASTVQSNKGARVGVFGATLIYGVDQLVWDMATDLETGVSEAASTLFFFYITEDGTPKISDIAPDDFTNERGGLYHPHETWRCIGQAWNNSSQDLEKVISYHTDDASVAKAASSVAASALTLEYWTSPLVNYALYDQDDANNAKEKVVKFPFYQSITIPSTATLGHLANAGAAAAYTFDNVVLHIVTQDNYRTLGVSSHQHGQGHLTTTTALSASSDSGNLYSLEAYTAAQNLAIAYGSTGQTTAGTWAANMNNFKAGHKLNICRYLSSVDSSTFSTTSSTIVAITNLTLTPYVTGSRSFEVYLVSGDAADFSNGYIRITGSSSITARAVLKLYAGGSPIRVELFGLQIGAVANPNLYLPPGSVAEFCHAAELATGNLTMAMYGKVAAGSGTLYIDNCRLVVQEMPYDGDS